MICLIRLVTNFYLVKVDTTYIVFVLDLQVMSYIVTLNVNRFETKEESSHVRVESVWYMERCVKWMISECRCVDG